MRGLSLVAALLTIAEVSSFWSGRAQSLDFTAGPEWRNAWKQVAELVPVAPSSKLVVEWPNNAKIEPNATTSVGLMTERPTLNWKSERGALYTVMIMDAGIKYLLPQVLMHWMVTNVPGNYLKSGNEVMDYLTPVSFEFNDDNSINKDRELSKHPLIILVFKQSGRISVEETHAGCTTDMLTARLHNYRDLVTKYDLSLVAGNYLQMPYSGYSTDNLLCRITKCTKSASPFPVVPGVNDLPECQPREDIMDITVRGPQLDKLKEYSKYTSKYSLDSVTHILQDTAPAASTGKATEYTAIEGAFNGAPFGSNNLENTLEGIVDATFFTYKDKKATDDLFFGVYPEVFEVIPPTFQTMANNQAITIVLSEPEDQDFDFENILSKPGMVFELQIVRVKKGQEAEFEEARDRMIMRSRNNNNVKSVTKFDVNRDVLTDERGELQIETENMETTIIVYPSMFARSRANAELRGTKDFKTFVDTFDCIMCSLMKDQNRPEYYPPFE